MVARVVGSCFPLYHFDIYTYMYVQYMHICKGAVCLCTCPCTLHTFIAAKVQWHVVCTCPVCGSHISIFGGVYSTGHHHVPSALVSQLKEESVCLVPGQSLCTLVIGSSNNRLLLLVHAVYYMHMSVVSTSYMAGWYTATQADIYM